jgi:hypothetical protein
VRDPTETFAEVFTDTGMTEYVQNLANKIHMAVHQLVDESLTDWDDEMAKEVVAHTVLLLATSEAFSTMHLHEVTDLLRRTHRIYAREQGAYLKLATNGAEDG